MSTHNSAFNWCIWSAFFSEKWSEDVDTLSALISIQSHTVLSAEVKMLTHNSAFNWCIWSAFFSEKWSEDVDTLSALISIQSHTVLSAEVKMLTHDRALIKAFGPTVYPVLKCSSGTTRAGITQILHSFVTKITVVLIDCLRYRIEIGCTVSQRSSIVLLRKLLLWLILLEIQDASWAESTQNTDEEEAEPGRIALHEYLYWSSSVQGSEMWLLISYSAASHYAFCFFSPGSSIRFRLVNVSHDRRFSHVSIEHIKYSWSFRSHDQLVFE